METMVVAEDILCLMMTTMIMMLLMMPFVWGILFGMHLVNSQETKVVYHEVHPCFKGHTVVTIVMETMAASSTIKEVGLLSSCFVLLNLGHRLSFQSKMNL
jgi:hypothetical protein